MILKKSREELNRLAIERLEKYTDITNISPGGRATLLLEIFNETMAEYYNDLEANVYMAYVSKAQGQFLDWIGEIVNCNRVPGESDDNYRFRITQQIYVANGSNRTAIRLRALSVPGVRDVIEVPFSMGTGSFSVYVVPNDPALGQAIVNRVQGILDEYQSFGIKGHALLPKEARFRINISLELDETGQNNYTSIRRSVQRRIRDYINTRAMGETLVMVDLISEINNTHESIRNFRINSMNIKNKPVLVQDYKLHWDEKLTTSINDITVG